MLIEFGQLNIYLIFPLIMPIFWCLRTYLNTYIQKENNPIIHSPFFLAFLAIIADLLAGGIKPLIQCILRLHKTQSKSTSTSESDEGERKTPFSQTEGLQMYVQRFIMSTNSYNDKKINILKTYLLIAVNSLIESSFLISLTILATQEANSATICFNMIILLLILESLLGLLLFRIQIYSHQILSMCMISIAIITLFFTSKNYETNNLWIYLIYFGVYCFVAFLDISQKWLMENKYYSPFRLLLNQGLFSICIFCLLFIILLFIPCPNWKFCDKNRLIGKNFNTPMENIYGTLIDFFTQDNIGINILIIVGYLISCSVYVLFLFMTIYMYSPTHRCINDTIGAFYYWLILIIKDNSLFNWLTFVLYFILFLGAFIYNDVIILNFWGLGENTKKNIQLRGRRETESNSALNMTNAELNSFILDK